MESKLPLTQKYKPKSLREIVGQEEAIKKLSDFVLNYSKQKKKMAFVYGPSGTGLTSSVYGLGKDIDYEILEINASDLRNKDRIDVVIKPAITQYSLFKKGKIVLIDEIDCLTVKDRGCLQELAKLAEGSSFPIILSANDVWNKKLNTIRSKTLLIEFKKLTIASIIKILEEIARKEDIQIEKNVFMEIASKSSGDVRAAINDLQLLSYIEPTSKKNITEEDLKILGYREKSENIFNSLKLIFKSKDIEVVKAFDNITSMNMGEFLFWVDENLPLEYKHKDLEKAYNSLSLADIYSKRIMNWQHWRFLVYINLFLTLGVALSKEKVNPDYISYKKPSRILKMYIQKQKSLKKMAVVEKLAKKTHTSIKRARHDFEIFKIIFTNSSDEIKEDLAKELKLKEEEIEILN